MKFYKNLIFIIFISVFSFSIIAAESDNVNTDSADFNTGNYEDEIFDPLEPVNRAIFSLKIELFLVLIILQIKSF